MIKVYLTVQHTCPGEMVTDVDVGKLVPLTHIHHLYEWHAVIEIRHLYK